MTIASVRQSSFAAGEVSPSFFGRMDFAKFDIALRKCRNWIIGPHGSAFNRPGMQYVATTKTTGNSVRLIPFQFSDGQAYALEFGNLYVRFYQNGAAVLVPTASAYAGGLQTAGYVCTDGGYYWVKIKTGSTTPALNSEWIRVGVPGAVMELVSPYATEELPHLKFAQSGDVIVFAGQSRMPQKVSRYTNNAWKIEPYMIGLSAYVPPISGGLYTVGLTTQTADGTVGFYPQVSGTPPAAPLENHKLWGYGVSVVVTGIETLPQFTNEVYMLPAATRPNYNSTTVARGQPVQIQFQVTPSPEFIKIYKGRKGAYGLLTILPGDYPLSAWVDDGSLTPDFSTPPPEGGGFPGTNLSLNGYGSTFPAWTTGTLYYKGDRVQNGGFVYEAEMTGRTASSGGPVHIAGSKRDIDPTYGPFTWSVDRITHALNEYVISNGLLYKCSQAGTINQAPGLASACGPYSRTTGITDGTCKWDYVAGVGDTSAIISWKFVGSVGSVLLDFPGVVTFVDQRLVFANSLARPAHIWGSEVGNYTNFFDYHLPTIASDPYDFDLAYNTFEEVRGFLPAPKTFMALTSHVEWALTSGSGDALSPTNVNARANSQRGCSWLDPKLIGNAGVFVQARLPRVRELVFDFYTQSYGGNDLSALAPHLFDGYQIVDWAYQKLPIPTLWLVRSDGKILSCTYIKEQDFVAWSWHDTTGGADLIENICVLSELDPYSTQTAYIDVIYLVVKRGTARMVERMAPSPSVPILGTSMGVYLDSAVVHSGTPSSIITGLWNLESRGVMVLGDDNVYGPYTVSGGQIDITADCPDGVSRSIVGLIIYSDIEFLPPKIPGPDLKRSNVKIVHRISVELANSRGGLWFGPDYTHMNEWRQRDVRDEYGAVHPYTGLDHVRLSGVSYDHDATLCIRQLDPLPVNLLAIEREIDVGGD